MRDQIVREHMAWLYQYVLGMTENNWKDMRDFAERQLNELSQELGVEQKSSERAGVAP